MCGFAVGTLALGLAASRIPAPAQETRHASEATSGTLAAHVFIEAAQPRGDAAAAEQGLAALWLLQRLEANRTSAIVHLQRADGGGVGTGAISAIAVVPALPLDGGLGRSAALYEVPGADAVLQYIQQQQWPVAEAIQVATCESGLDPLAENGTNIGAFQVNIAAHPHTREQMLDPVQNVAAAYALWLDQGWAPWACAPSG